MTMTMMAAAMAKMRTTATTPPMIATELSELDDGAAIDGPTGTAIQTHIPINYHNVIPIVTLKSWGCAWDEATISSMSTLPDIPAEVNVLTVTSYSAPGCRPGMMT